MYCLIKGLHLVQHTLKKGVFWVDFLQLNKKGAQLMENLLVQVILVLQFVHKVVLPNLNHLKSKRMKEWHAMDM